MRKEEHFQAILDNEETAVAEDPLDTLLESLYASVLEPKRLENFCGGLASATGSHISAIMVQDMQLQGGRLDLVVGADPLQAARYEQEFAADNLWLKHGAQRLVTGAVLNSDDFVSRSELHRSRYFNEYLRDGDVEQSVALCAHFDGQSVVTATVCRSGKLPPYPAKHLDLLHRVAQHWVNAYAMQRRLSWLENRVRSLEEAIEQVPIAMFMLDGTGRVLRCNEAAEQLLISGRLRRDLGKLTAPGANASAFNALLRAAVTGLPKDGGVCRHHGNCVLRNAESRADLVAAVHPLPQTIIGASAALFVQPVTAPVNSNATDLLRRAFHLTASEAELALGLYRNADLAEAAKACGISPATAKTRLQVVYDKTGEHGQAALMRLLAALVNANASLPPNKSG